MKNKIKMLGVGMIALFGLFAGANLASAQTAPQTTCTSATIYGTLTDMGGATVVSAWFEWGTTQSFGYTTASKSLYAPQTFSQYLSGLTANTTYYYRAMFSNAYGTTPGGILSFTTPSCAPAASLPTVTTNSANSVLQTSATLNGYVNANGSNVNAWFEWGTTQSFGNTTTSVNYGTTATSFSNSLYTLASNTTYYYRAVAQNAQGTVYGSMLSFTTSAPVTSLPTVTTNSANVVSQSSATLNGFVNANGSNGTAWFEYGTTQSFGQQTSNVSYGNTSMSFTGGAYSLAANTTYYYRAVAQSAQGGAVVYGSTLSFVTTSNVSTPTVTTNSANVLSQNSASLSGYVSGNGSSVDAWFEYGTTQSFGLTTNSVNYGNTSTSFSGSAYGLVANTTYYYRAVARNSQGGSNVYGSTLSFTTTGNSNNGNIASVSTRNADVSGSYASLNGYVDPNYSSDTVRWFEYGTTQSLGYTTTMLSHGTVASLFSAPITNLTSNTTYYYRAVARNSQGTVYGSTLSFTTTYQPSLVSGVAPAVTTLLATETTATTARLNGLVFASNGQSSNAWFEWGSTSSLGSKTQTVGVGALPTVKHSDYISGLTAGQTYYYRIVAENSYGKEYGTVNTFVAEASTYVAPVTSTPVVYKPTTTVITRSGSAQSLVTLSVEGGAEMIMSGEKRTYRVTWKNTGTQSLNNVVLRVTFPKTMNVESATKGTFSGADNSVIVDLKTLAAGESGDTFIFTTAGRGLKSGELLVVTANMVYTSANGTQGDAIAYMTHRAEVAQNVIGASVFGAGSFTPTTLLGWVSLLGLVLVLVLLGNHLYGRFTD